MNYPSISAKCITYGRVSTLEEAIYSFLQQDYPGEKELVIVNDYPKQKLIFDHPEIKIIIRDLQLHLEVENSLDSFEDTSCDVIQKINNYIFVCELTAI